MAEVVELMIGDRAPDFDCLIMGGDNIILSKIIGNEKGVILYFYPRDNTPGCTIQACDFRDSFSQLENEGWKVIGVSTDSSASHEKFTSKYNLPFDLIVDENSDLHIKYGTWRKKNMYGKEYMGCLRSTFVISADGTISWVKYGVKAKGHVEELMSELGVE
jgi:peroxiredoxin Q/BCP|tara:strand:+ start:21 stop:503 length:483 start_codon:yes stop_codon:yes gene_type:complete